MTEHQGPRTARARLLAQAEPSHAAGIADAVVIKDGGLYFLSQPDGGVPLGNTHGYGLFYQDCRFLSGYQMRLADHQLESLAATGADGFRSLFQLTNPNIDPVGEGISRQRIGVRWRHVIDTGRRSLHDEITIENYDLQTHALPLSLELQADFLDVFVIRGLIDLRPGTHERPAWDGDRLVFAYQGGDGRRRELSVHFSRPPDRVEATTAVFDLVLAPRERVDLELTLAVSVADDRDGQAVAEPAESRRRARETSIEDWMHGFAGVRSSSFRLEQAIDRSLRDLRALRTTIGEHGFFAAGVPWFVTLFGRDSLTCALQTLAYRPEIAAETLRVLAEFQGRKEDAWCDEEPGKILHELRSGELARMGEIPYAPYYGTVDATPLFIIVLAEYVRWTGDRALVDELRAPFEAALRWIDDYGDHDGDGYVDYESESADRLINQGWKDSGAAIVNADGHSATPPIALVEVQGYVYRARHAAADLFEAAGEADRAAALRKSAETLREQFNRDFWMPDQSFYALALQKGGRQAAVISSNPGHALWTGIIDDARARAVVDRLLAEDMHSGWGIRTLSTSERAYNPVGYHLGTVWPHDNGFITAGMRRYGFDKEACSLFSDLLLAASFFEDARLPEAFAGYSRSDYGVPVRYPVACHPQAWAAGTLPFVLQTLLGIEPDAPNGRLSVTRPCLPPFVRWLRFERLKVGGATLDLHFERRDGDGRITVDVERQDGALDVMLPSTSPASAR